MNTFSTYVRNSLFTSYGSVIILVILDYFLLISLFGAIPSLSAALPLYLCCLVFTSDLFGVFAGGVFRAHTPKSSKLFSLEFVEFFAHLALVGYSLMFARGADWLTQLIWLGFCLIIILANIALVILALNSHDPTLLETTDGAIGLPNWVSLIRLGVSLFIPYIYIATPFSKASAPIATVLLLLAIGTDALDGFLARRTGQTTKVGKALDPICDKAIFYPTAIAFTVLTNGSLLTGALLGPLTIIFLSAMVFRDLVILIWFALYYHNLRHGIGASLIDKLRMAAMCVWLGLIALSVSLPSSLTVPPILNALVAIALFAIAILSILSLVVDYRRFRAALAKKSCS